MAELTLVGVARPETVAAIAAQNRAYSNLIDVALDNLERRAEAGVFEWHREVRHVLWFYGRDGGMQPGGFIGHLLAAIDGADMENRRKLGLGFQSYVVLVEVMKQVPDGAERLRRLVA